jgi:hypothetical protein
MVSIIGIKYVMNNLCKINMYENVVFKSYLRLLWSEVIEFFSF